MPESKSPKNQEFVARIAKQLAEALAEKLADPKAVFDHSDYGFSEHRQAYTGRLSTENGFVLESTLYLKLTCPRPNREEPPCRISLSKFFEDHERNPQSL